MDPDIAPPTVAIDARSAEAFESARIRKVENNVRLLRNVGIASWSLVLWILPSEMLHPAAWPTYAGLVVATILAHVAIGRGRNPRRTAIATSLLDPLIGAAICAVTGGIASPFMAYLYFTLMSVAIRLGIRESLLQAIFNAALILALDRFAPAPAAPEGLLGTVLLILAFAASLGVVVALWARQRAGLAMAYAHTLQEAGRRYQDFVQRFAQAQEEERQIISAELHDRMSGHMFLLRRGIEACLDRRHDPSALEDQLATLAERVSACTADVRSVMNQLRPTVLDELGFFEAAGEYLSRQKATVEGTLSWGFDPVLKHWRSAHDALLFRLLQEALLNTQKHAQASRVHVELKAQGDRVVLLIEDDGVGFDPARTPTGHYGIMTMRERAAGAGGTLEIRSGAGGTRVTVTLPLGDP